MGKAKNKILIVDDTIKNMQIFGNILKSKNFHVTYATNGYEALSILKSEPFDLVLLDILMPGMDGFEVCKKIKSNPLTNEIPIIFLTAVVDKDDVKKAFELGAVDYVTKPFSPPELISRIRINLILSMEKENLQTKMKRSTLKQNVQLEEIKMLKLEIEQLKKSKKEIIKIEKSKYSFLKKICYEIRTPASGILGFSEILKKEPTKSNIEKNTGAMLSAARKIINYSNKAVLISQIEPDIIFDSMRPTKIKSLTDYAIEETKKSCDEKNIKIRSEISENLCEICIEPEFTKEIIQIVLNNAVALSPENSEIVLSAEEYLDKITLKINDRGPGFPEDTYNKIKNFLTDDTAFQNNNWPGLDFAEVKLIMDIHKGKIEVLNKTNGGAEVSLIFPVNEARVEAMHQSLSQLN